MDFIASSASPPVEGRDESGNPFDKRVRRDSPRHIAGSLTQGEIEHSDMLVPFKVEAASVAEPRCPRIAKICSR